MTYTPIALLSGQNSLGVGLVLGVACGLLPALPAHAALVGLCNTGWTANCAAVHPLSPPGGTYSDPNHVLVVDANRGITPRPAVLVDAGQFPIRPPGPWLPDSRSSHWIGPAKNQLATGGCCVAGAYVYRDDFVFTSEEPTLVFGRWAVDNLATIRLDGVGPVLAVNGIANLWTPFSFTLAGAAGSAHSLQFTVNNTGQATGLRVEFLGFEAVPVPEPFGSTLAPALGGLALLALFSRRRAQA